MGENRLININFHIFFPQFGPKNFHNFKICSGHHISPKRALKSLGMSDFPFRTYPDVVVETAYNNIVFFKNRVLINYFIMHIDNSQFSLNEARRYLSILENCRYICRSISDQLRR